MAGGIKGLLGKARARILTNHGGNVVDSLHPRPGVERDMFLLQRGADSLSVPALEPC